MKTKTPEEKNTKTTKTAAPICDFAMAYSLGGAVRAHMPAHKGAGDLGVEALDITEIDGADELYGARGIIRESEKNAASVFGTGATYYSAEGSSLVIRAMMFLALMNAKMQNRASRTVLAGRNAHKTLMSAAALLDIDIKWLYPENGEVLFCDIGAKEVLNALDALEEKPIAVYVTSPDYLGNIADIASIAEAAHSRGVPLIVDNAHGAYLRFLETDAHPITLGADMCSDSAHKTLPCLTGAAYLHIAKDAPAPFFEFAERALALFASTSPSYLILQSLDMFNANAPEYEEKLRLTAERLKRLKQELLAYGYELIGNEEIKLTVAPKRMGYTGTELAAHLRKNGVECEFSDMDYTVLMLSGETRLSDILRIKKALLKLKKRESIIEAPPRAPRLERRLSIREAVLSPQESVKTDDAEGRTVALDYCGCPPAVPIAVAGETLDRDAIMTMKYYGIEECSVVK